jgi:hypothetical protein
MPAIAQHSMRAGSRLLQALAKYSRAWSFAVQAGKLQERMTRGLECSA